MLRGQVAVEFLVLFTIGLFIFILAATFFPAQLREAADAESQADQLLEQIKVRAIVASTSRTDFNTSLFVPPVINGLPIVLSVSSGSDSVARVFQNGRLLASAQLPLIEDVFEENLINQIRIHKNASGVFVTI